MNDIPPVSSKAKPNSMGDMVDVLEGVPANLKLSPRQESVLKRLQKTEEAETVEFHGKKFNEREFFKLTKSHELDDLLKDYN